MALRPVPTPYGQIANQTIGQAQQMGYFSPQGSPALRESLRRGAARTARNRRLRGQQTFQLGNLDPAQARAASLNLENSIGQDTGDYINNANLQYDVGNQDYARGLFGGQLGFEQQQVLQRQQEEAQRRAQGNPALAGLGQLAGTAIGGFVGGPGGAMLGQRLFGRGGGPSGYGPRSSAYGGYGYG